MSQEVLRIIQISDTHLFADKDQTFLGVKPQKNFEAILEMVKQENKKIDFILHSGDISQDHSEQSYIRAEEMFAPLNVPVYCVPGNHDNSEVMNSLYPRGCVSNDKHILTKHWQIILLDSHKKNAVEGYLDQQQLDYLHDCLREHSMHHAVVMFHHQPIPVGSAWLDKLGLTNAGEFWEIISKFPQVNTVLFGHVHQEFEQINHEIKCYSTPATCFQFMRKQNHFGLENLPPGYRWINLFNDGRIETQVVRAANYIGHFDEAAKGY